MAASSSSTVVDITPTHETERRELERSPIMRSPIRAKGATSSQSTLVIDKTLSSVSNLMQLLPTGTVLIFQALSPSFTNQGKCYISNKYLTALLLYLCVLSCVFFTFTDSLVGSDGKTYYGLATFKGFYVFNYEGDDADRQVIFSNLQKYKIRFIDYVHASLGVLVFLALAFSDSSIQDCFFPVAGSDTKELLLNLPLGAGFLASMIFIIIPTTRKGIGFAEASTS